MKIQNLTKLLFLNCFLIFTSCEKETIYEKVLNDNSQDKFIITLEDAQQIGLNHFDVKRNDRLIIKSGRRIQDFSKKAIRDKKTVRKNEIDIFHIINFEGGGFIIISADKRVTPVLAYSETDNFDDENLPGISDWTMAVSDGVLKAKNELLEPREREARLWEIYENSASFFPNAIEPPDDECDCDPNHYYFSTGQFVNQKTKWCQGGQYSWYSPGDGGCSCERKPSGCGPVAMAMVMNYYQFPNMTMTFNGESIITNYPMPMTIPYDCTYPSNVYNRQVSMLIRLCGSFSGSIYGILGNCSTATYPGNVNNAFVNMGYSNGGSWGSLDDKYNSLKNDLKSYHPVILTGTTGILNTSNAHIWIADGYESYSYQYEATYIDEYGNPHCYCADYGIEMISMCWGQYNASGNGFYLANYSFTDGSGDVYDTYLRALTGIRP